MRRFRVNLKKFVVNQRAPIQEQARSGMSFEVSEANSSEVVERPELGIESAVVRSGRSYFYSVGYPSGIGRNDVHGIELAKAKVIERLSSSQSEIGIGMLDQARVLARDELLNHFDPERSTYLSYFIAHDTVGYGPFSILLADRKNIEEIEVNSPTMPITIYTTKYGRCATNIRFVDENSFRYNVNKLASESEKELSDETPIVDVQVGDSRIHAQIRPYAISGAAASIRIGGEKRVTLDFLLKGGMVDTETLAYLWLAVDADLNMVIAGAPASGKTTLLTAISGFVPLRSRIVTVEEDINELKFNDSFTNVIALYGEKYRVTTKEQVLNALRLRPDRIVVGEIRGDEAKDLFAGSNIGIPFMTTMHCNDDPLGVIKRLSVKPMGVETRSISMLDLSIHTAHSDFKGRRLSSIYEYKWLSRAETMEGVAIGDGDMVNSVRIASNGRLEKGALSESKVIGSFSKKYGFSMRKTMQELEKRARFLEKHGSGSMPVTRLSETISEYING
jgi:flagellar protein FlaI